MLRIFAVLLFCCTTGSALAQTDVSQDFGEFRVHYSVFNSSFISPEVARTYNLTRGDNIALVNIAVTRVSGVSESLGLPANVSGRVQNLLMQSRNLTFKEIHEGQAYYYLASFRINNEDPEHFFINVTPPGYRAPLEITFTRTLYSN